ncbi:MAG: prepilin-type N-terminal cleavage/methylation domain-containing protein [Fibrella sp.]|nr:prepilin-type N-terminal cleavage/methylation domain-containing protein [Armatimonadota bacterium]
MKKAFTLVELLSVLAILALLMAILFPVLSNSRKSSYKATCQANLHTVGQTVRLYVDDYDGNWPDSQVWSTWNRADTAFPKSSRGTFPRLMGCPSVTVPADRKDFIEGRGDIAGYTSNANISERTDDKFIYPATTVTFLDAALDVIRAYGPDPYIDTTWNPYPYNVEKGYERHNGGANYLFFDGHVKWLHKEQVSPTDRGNDGTKPAFALHEKTAQ